MTPIEFCDLHNACQDGRDFALQFATMAEVWDACERPEWLSWILERTKPLQKEQSVRLAIAFAETAVVHVPEGEDRPRLAIEAAKAWLENPTEENRVAAADAADAAAAYAAADYAAAAYAARAAAARADADYAAYVTASRSAAAYAAADADAAASDYVTAYAAARNRQCQIIRESVKNPFA